MGIKVAELNTLSDGKGMGDFQSTVHMLITRWRYG